MWMWCCSRFLLCKCLHSTLCSWPISFLFSLKKKKKTVLMFYVLYIYTMYVIHIATQLSLLVTPTVSLLLTFYVRKQSCNIIDFFFSLDDKKADTCTHNQQHITILFPQFSTFIAVTLPLYKMIGVYNMYGFYVCTNL